MSIVGLVWDLIKFLNITIQNGSLVLLFLRPLDEYLQILNVFLLPGNIDLEEVKAQQGDAKYIRIFSECQLMIGESYSVHCDEASKIQPECAPFAINHGANFYPTFEVFLPANQEKVVLMVKDKEGKQVWERVVNLPGQKRKNLPAGDIVSAERDKMTKMDLIYLLEDLREDEFMSFKFYLENEKVGNIKPIRVSRLLEADRMHTVDLMVQKYGFDGAVKVMRSILKKINRNDLVRELPNISSGAEAGGTPLALKEELFNTLEDLEDNEFKKFKWFLLQDDILRGFKGIPVSQLEKAGRRDTVDLMIQKHQDHGALHVTMKVLQKIARNDLMQRLQKLQSGPKATSHQPIYSAQGGSSVVVPSITGSNIGNINITITSPVRGPGQSVPTDERLMSVRRQFINKVSEPVLYQLLDKLLEGGIITDGEMESARTLNRAEKARLVIDMVRKKGTEASSALITALYEMDPSLSAELESGPSTSNTTLDVSEDVKERQLDPDDPERLKQQQLVCRENLTEATYWQGFTPEVLTESANISYRFRCSGPGVFQCTLTRLVFVMVKETELLYSSVQWDESVLQPAGKMAAGLLFNIQSPGSPGAVSQLHLPHCETMDAPLPEGLLSVAHITDDGMSFLEPLKITDTHVVVNVPHLSDFGLLRDLAIFLNIPIRIRGQVLLFLRPPDRHDRKLNVFLQPDNIPLPEVKAQQGGAKYIECPSECRLINRRIYSVHCDEPSKIQPEYKEFCPKYGPNFFPTFVVSLPINQEKVTLTVKDKKGTPVWKYVVNLPGGESSSGARGEQRPTTSEQPAGPGPAETQSDPAEMKLKSARRQFIDRVSESNLRQLLDILLERRVINDGEMESARTLTRAQKAELVIDMVRNKGKKASSALIAALCEVDQCLSEELKLQ